MPLVTSTGAPHHPTSSSWTRSRISSGDNVDSRCNRPRLPLGDRNNMKLDGPDRFELRFTPTSCTVVHPNGVRTFHGRSAQSWPKLYVAVAERKPIYVGVTRQSLSKRLRLGWNADGASGYHGYAWRHKLTAASLMVWYADADRQAESQR